MLIFIYLGKKFKSWYFQNKPFRLLPIRCDDQIGEQSENIFKFSFKLVFPSVYRFPTRAIPANKPSGLTPYPEPINGGQREKILRYWSISTLRLLREDIRSGKPIDIRG